MENGEWRLYSCAGSGTCKRKGRTSDDGLMISKILLYGGMV